MMSMRSMKTCSRSQESGPARPTRKAVVVASAALSVVATARSNVATYSEKNLDEEEDREEGEGDMPSNASISESMGGGSDYEPKRKRSKNALSSALPAKRAKITTLSTVSANAKGKEKESLSLLLTMPLDILFEILSGLSPRDIICVSRTSHLFHVTLMSPNASSVWKTACKRDGAPPCPNYLKEPQWAVLLYGNICQTCGTKNIQGVDLLIMRRVCKNCKKNHLLVKSRFKAHFPDNDVAVLDMVPYTHAGPWTQGYPSKSHFFWDQDIENTIRELTILEHSIYMNSPNAKSVLDEYKSQKAARIVHSQENHHTWNKWIKEMQDKLLQAKYDGQMNRIGQIKQRFKAMGYKEEDLFFLYRHDQSMKKGAITDRVWKRLRAELEPTALAHQKIRLEREHRPIRNVRRTIVDQRYNAFKRTLRPFQWKYLPRTLEICAFEPFARHVEAGLNVKVTPQDFDEAFEQLPELLSTMAQRMKEIVWATMPAGSSTPSAPGDIKLTRSKSTLLLNMGESRSSTFSTDHLNLAISLFECTVPSCIHRNRGHIMTADIPLLFGWEGVASHHCQSETEGLTSSSILSTSISCSHIHFSWRGSKAAQEVIKLAGLDFNSATVDNMDGKDARFACMTCASQKSNDHVWMRPGYTWRTMVNHIASETSHPDGPYDFVLLSDADTNTVKRSELEDAKWNQQKWTCARCPEHFNNLKTKAEVMQHLYDSHAISAPTAPIDYFFFERFFTNLQTKPSYQVGTDPTKVNIKCLMCAHGTLRQNERLFNLGGVLSHLKSKYITLKSGFEAGGLFRL